jgi:hypothetical protein
VTGNVIRIAISEAAFEAITKTLPLGSVAYENAVDQKGERYVWLAEVCVNRLDAAQISRSLLQQGGQIWT